MELKLPHVSALKFSIVALLCQNSVPAVAQQADATPLREVIVSYAEGEGKMQLFRMKEDGSARQAITDGTSDCMMPAWSPDGQKVAYTREDNGQLNLWVCDPEGQTHKPLTKSGRNLVSSWLPDSSHLVWMVSQQRKAAEEPAANSQLWIMNTETLDARKLFGDSEQGKFSNAMEITSHLFRIAAATSEYGLAILMAATPDSFRRSQPTSTRHSVCPSNRKSHPGHRTESESHTGKAWR